MAAIADAVVERLRPLLESRAGTPEPRLLTVKQAAVYLGRTETATRQLAAAGGIPVVRGDARVMFDRRDLEQWIDRHKS